MSSPDRQDDSQQNPVANHAVVPTVEARRAGIRDVTALTRLARDADRRTARAGRTGVFGRRPSRSGRALQVVNLALNLLAGTVWTTDERAAVVTMVPRRVETPRWRLNWRAARAAAAVGSVFVAVLAVCVLVPWWPVLLVPLAGLLWLSHLGRREWTSSHRALATERVAWADVLAASGDVWELADASSRGDHSGVPLWDAMLSAADENGTTLVLHTGGEGRTRYYERGGFEIVSSDTGSGRVLMVRQPQGRSPHVR